MFCSNCGTKLAEDAKFCSGCGKAVGVVSEQQVPAQEEEITLASHKVGLYDDDGKSVGTGILTNKRFILKQAGFMGITIPLANLLVEGKTVFELPYSDIADITIDKIGIFRSKCVCVIGKNGYIGKIMSETGSNSEFVEEWYNILKSQVY